MLSILALWFTGPVLAAYAPEETLVLEGATVIDVSDWGKRGEDLEDAVVVIRDGVIQEVGKQGELSWPEDATVHDVRGRFIVPGLIDAFAALNNQAYANAYLYSGVTSIVAVSGGRRGDLFEHPDPGPAIFKLDGTSRGPGTTEEALATIDRMAEQGVRVMLLMYGLRPEQLKPAIERCHRHGMAAVGELGHTRYEEGIALGLDAVVHTTRYSLDLAPEPMRLAVADQPFSDDLESPKWRYYRYLTGLAGDEGEVLRHASVLGKGGAALIPTFSLLYLDLPDHRNLWLEPVAGILDPADINRPADKTTGNHVEDSPVMKAYAELAQAELRLEKTYLSHGARYLAGSGTDVWGTMPGISLHTELEILIRIGLNERQALAAATANTAHTLKLGKIGQILPGYEADLLVLRENPMDGIENLKNIEMLILDGMIIELKPLLAPP